MSTVRDIVRQHSVSRDANGYRAERVFLIDGVSGAGQARLFLAMQDSTLPQYGDPHPVIPEIFVTKIEARPETISPETVRVLVFYSVPDEDSAAADDEDNAGELTITTSLVQEETVTDAFGELMFVEYATVDGLNVSITRKYFPAQIERPQLQVSFRRREAESPKSRINGYLGKVNASEWSGYDPRTWLCTGITGNQDGDEFVVDYAFAYREKTWDLEAFAQLTDAEATDYPINPETGNGYARYEVYPTANFNDLGLSF